MFSTSNDKKLLRHVCNVIDSIKELVFTGNERDPISQLAICRRITYTASWMTSHENYSVHRPRMSYMCYMSADRNFGGYDSVSIATVSAKFAD